MAREEWVLGGDRGERGERERRKWDRRSGEGEGEVGYGRSVKGGGKG